MKQWRFEISSKQGFPDVDGKDVLEDIRQLNITSVEDVISEKVFLIEADFEQDFAERVAGELLADPVCQDWHLGKSGIPAGPMAATLEVGAGGYGGRGGCFGADGAEVCPAG
ncbi:MAG: phosphoribosylformylglycinamidine synthase subunit PurS [Planctomycetota bacterium]